MTNKDYNPSMPILRRAWFRWRNDKPSTFLYRILHSSILMIMRAWGWWKVFKYKIKTRDRYIQKEVLGSKMYLDLEDKGLARDLLVHDIRERYSTKVMEDELWKLRDLGPGQVAVDIGANIGYYALLEAKILGEKGRVYCLEPAPENVGLLRRNIAENGYKNIEVFHAAAGAESKMGTIYLSDRHNQHTLVAENTVGMVGSMPVQVFAVDDFLKDKPYPSIIRMDVEGFELDILRGMKKILAQKKPLKFYIEIHGFFLKESGVRELLSILKTAGFHVKEVIWDPVEFGNPFKGWMRRLYYFFSEKLGIGHLGRSDPPPSMDELEKIFTGHGEITLAAFFERP